VYKREVESTILRADFENISLFKMRLWKKGAGVFDVF